MGKKVKRRESNKHRICKGIAPSVRLNPESLEPNSSLAANFLLNEAMARINTPQLIERNLRSQEPEGLKLANTINLLHAGVMRLMFCKVALIYLVRIR